MKRQLNSVSPHQRCFFSSFLSSHSCNYNETSTKKDCGKTGTENENGGLEVCWYLPPVFLTCWVKKKEAHFNRISSTHTPDSSQNLLGTKGLDLRALTQPREKCFHIFSNIQKEHRCFQRGGAGVTGQSGPSVFSYQRTFKPYKKHLFNLGSGEKVTLRTWQSSA